MATSKIEWTEEIQKISEWECMPTCLVNHPKKFKYIFFLYIRMKQISINQGYKA